MANQRIHTTRQLREHLLYLLNGGGAHARFDDAVKNMPEELRGAKPNGLPHSAWMLLEHLRLAQRDILEFSRNSKHTSPKWPKGYWPRDRSAASTAAWNKSIQQFRKDLKSMQDLVANPKTDLYARIPWGDGQTILREACCWPTTTPTTWASWSMCGDCWERGRDT